jgi:hypothetical protein
MMTSNEPAGPAVRPAAGALADPCLVERVGRALRRAGIASAEQLRQLRPDQVEALPGIGPVQAALIAEALAIGDDRLVAALAPKEAPPLAGPRPLTDREADALRLRYRPDGTVQRSVCAVAAGLGVSAPRSIQLVTHATAKLLEIARSARAGRPLAPDVERDWREFRGLVERGRSGASRARSLADSA